ncbi:hypothetical protein N7493_011104 [Penicillium malachiteum]|uniref:Uncharacterized protein n=1 Tax=Penicillium malachiteum TaxID=1324776 RepID=A0AAD6HBH1_9EURO|nr:hypothetical protein N7493_011104 [Penicillium malachiteum]
MVCNSQNEALLPLEAAMPDVIEAMKLAKSPSLSVGVLQEGEVIFRKSIVYLGPDGIIANTAKDHIAMVSALPTSNDAGRRFCSWWYFSSAVFGLLPLVIEAV